MQKTANPIAAFRIQGKDGTAQRLTFDSGRQTPVPPMPQ